MASYMIKIMYLREGKLSVYESSPNPNCKKSQKKRDQKVIWTNM